MDQSLTITMHNESVQFTPDGKVSVIDAIQAVTNSKCALSIWQSLKREHPDILLECEDHSFQRQTPTPVVTSKGWESIVMLLPDYLEASDLCES